MNGGTFIGTLDPRFNPFDGDYLAEILAATAHAWARMRPPRPNEIEDRITARLVGQLANAPEFLGGHPKPAIEGHFKTGQR